MMKLLHFCEKLPRKINFIIFIIKYGIIMKLQALIFFGGLALASCSPKTAKVTDETKVVTFPNAQVEEGFNLQAQYCGRCHKVKNAENYTREQWNDILPRMAKKAKITEEQQATINEYINWKLNI